MDLIWLLLDGLGWFLCWVALVSAGVIVAFVICALLLIVIYELQLRNYKEK